MSLIKVDNISYGYTDEKVLNAISFEIPEGSITMLIGPNGSGKSTLLKIMTGLIKPQQGSVRIVGSEPTAARHLYGYVPQHLTFDKSFPLTVREFIDLGGDLDDASMAKLQSLGVPELLEKKIGELSGGQLQRVLIGRSLLGDPKVLFMDEPVSGIDIGGEQDFYETMEKIRDEHKVAIVLVSHEVHLVNKIADQVVCVNKNMLCSGAPGKVLSPEIIQDLYGDHAALYEHKH